MQKCFVVCGSPGSGKSTYAEQLASLHHATLLDIDPVTERLVRLALAQSGQDVDDRDSEYFKSTFRAPIYETLFDIARENLPIQDVVVVGPFTKELRDPHWTSGLSKALGAEVEIHYVQCPTEIRKRRLASRGNARDLAKLNDWDDHIQYYGLESPPVFKHVLVDGSDLEGSIKTV
jgi:predicted kinase